MTGRILKHKFGYTAGVWTITTKEGARILSVDNQRGTPCLWYFEPDSGDVETRVFETYLTGAPVTITGDHEFIGTVLLENGTYVIHIFEEKD
jgi:hypothetical protein